MHVVQNNCIIAKRTVFKLLAKLKVSSIGIFEEIGKCEYF